MRARVRTTGLIAFAALAFAAPAHAASMTTNCGGLQAALTQAGPGDAITLNQLCTTSNSGASAGKFTLPTNASFTLTGQAGSGAGFDGTGVSGPVLSGSNVGGPTSATSFTLSSLIVENDNGGGSGAVMLESTSPGGITVQSMKFMNDGATSAGGSTGGGGLVMRDGYGTTAVPMAPFTLTGSTFSGNSVTNTTGPALGGGAAIFDGFGAATRSAVVTGNVFSGNHATSATTAVGNFAVFGGGLAVIVLGGTAIQPLTQSGNTFTGNSVTGSAGVTTSNYGGGGEWIEGMNLTSTNDSFTNNTATGATGSSGGWTWGAGLGIINSSCTLSSHTVGTATQLVASGNTIAGGAPADVNGAGIYTGCGPGTGSDLTLQDSTVSGNSSVAGSIAGIGGESVDHLTLGNTIDTGNIGGTDVGGFNGTGGSITASYSDACASGAALPGTSNICAPPALVSATDVHETASSPTIDKGSNALIPAGLTMDFFGNTRALAGTAVCAVPFPPAIVDIGAAEYVPANPNCTNPKPNPNPTPTPPSPHVTKAIFDNQRIVLTTPSLSACTASTKRLPVRIASTKIKGSTGAKLKFSSVAFYLDKGIKHTTHRRHKGKTVTVTVYLANSTAHHVPVTVHLSLAGLKSGTHTLKVVLSYKKHVKKKTVTVTKTMKARFVVC
jgi:hypothetical protein